jgi:molybdopterin molybdotransferase
LCTGTEVVEPGEEPAGGQIFNANGPMLGALMRPACRSFEYLGTVGDDREELLARVQRGLDSDVLVITGGVSMGQYDLVPDVLEEAGVGQICHKVAIKPGKPTYFGRTERTLVFGMPGNPQSCFVIFKMIVEPALAAMGGLRASLPRFETGRSAEGFPNKPARMNVMPCRIDQDDGGVLIRRQPYHGSADIVGPAEADGYFVVPRGTEYVREGQTLRFFRI